MNDLMIYIYESGICLAVLFALYWLILRKETYFRFNRFYLLGAILVSCLLPLGHISVFGSEASTLGAVPRVVNAIRLPELIITEGSNYVIASSNNWQLIIFMIYISGAVLLMLRMILGIMKVSMLKRKGTMIKHDGYSVIYMRQEIAPFSFFRTIFIQNTRIEPSDERHILNHERIHIKQKHSYDNIFVEVFLIIFWFNPFMWLLKGALRNTHEYLADTGAVNETSSLSTYQSLLLKQIIGLFPIVVTNSFNSNIKKRIKMMSRNKSSVLAKFKPLLLAPVLVCLTLIFACSEKPMDFTDDLNLEEPVLVEAEAMELVTEENNDQNATDQEGEEVFYIVEEMPTFNGGEPASEFRIFVSRNLRYPESAEENGIEGRVIIQFAVDKNGDVVDPVVVRSISPELDKESLRVVSSSPKWTPGKQGGKAVKVLYTFPINFILP